MLLNMAIFWCGGKKGESYDLCCMFDFHSILLQYAKTNIRRGSFEWLIICGCTRAKVHSTRALLDRRHWVMRNPRANFHHTEVSLNPSARCVRWIIRKKRRLLRHIHENSQFTWITSGYIKNKSQIKNKNDTPKNKLGMSNATWREEWCKNCGHTKNGVVSDCFWAARGIRETFKQGKSSQKMQMVQ